jgi:hypothetical protein
MIEITQKGDWQPTKRWLDRLSKLQLDAVLNKYGQQGVDALSNATPVETGLTSRSWYFETVTRGRSYYSIRWYNSHVENGIPIAVILQYGHGTGTGGYVQGRDYIMPAIRPVFDKITEEALKELGRG